ncbi:CbiX/SirB N-terminal domain-containing protein [Sedimentitalea sp. XS_ASV28]|uniref:CbiX/SirB N-terminal domain-containing protein n=1 Tax=Sedimentitalea sp. XS_ASV28 TaxID=3241296 RepID=UPI003517DC23
MTSDHDLPQAIIVSHGQPSDPDPAEAILAELAQRVAGNLPGWTVRSATLAKTGALEAAMQQCRATPVVYPLFMTDGWFTRTMLPKRLGGAKAHILPPLGTDPGLPDLAAGIIRGELGKRHWHAAETCLVVASHGSGKSRNSARDTENFLGALSGQMQFALARAGYIEETPFLKDAARFDTDQAVCLPFFAARGGHVIDDIPQALDEAAFRGVRLAPIGTHPEIAAMIAAALRNHGG